MKFLSGPRAKLLRDPPFASYMLNCFLSTFGSGLSYIITSWLILTVSNKVISLLVLAICFWLPSALLGPFWGVVVDRYSRKWLLIYSNAVRALILFGYSLYVHFYSMTTHSLDILMLLLGSMFGMIFPTSVAFIRELVKPEKLLHANTMVDITYEVGNVVGMGLAGFLLALVSPTKAFAINGLVFLVAALSIILLKEKYKRPTEKRKTTISHEFVLGLQYLGSNRALTLIYIIQLLILSAVMITPVLIAPFAKNILHADSIEFSTIETALSVGIIIGGVMLPWIVKKSGFRKTLSWLIALLVIFFVLFALNTHLSTSIILYLAIGFVLSSWPLIVTKAQDMTQHKFQGRVQAVFTSISSFIVLVTYCFVAIGSHFIGVRLLYLFPALLALLAFIVVSTQKKIDPA